MCWGWIQGGEDRCVVHMLVAVEAPRCIWELFTHDRNKLGVDLAFRIFVGQIHETLALEPFRHAFQQD